MIQIAPHLWRHATYDQYIDLTFNQYLLAGSEPVLIHTGADPDAPALLRALQGRTVSYIFVSHFESDECGALCSILAVYPGSTVITGEVTARQLAGFGITDQVTVARDGDVLPIGGLELEMIAYPSEMHLWDGLLCYERHTRIFFSSDLMIRFGHSGEEVHQSAWKAEVEAIGPLQIADAERRALLKRRLLPLSVDLVAPGHGPILRV